MDSNTVSIVSVVTSALVGIVGTVSTTLTKKGDRKHERATRVRDERVSSYQKALARVDDAQTRLERDLSGAPVPTSEIFEYADVLLQDGSLAIWGTVRFFDKFQSCALELTVINDATRAAVAQYGPRIEEIQRAIAAAESRPTKVTPEQVAHLQRELINLTEEWTATRDGLATDLHRCKANLAGLRSQARKDLRRYM